jgi:hydroxyacylglutathione hydrolase
LEGCEVNGDDGNGHELAGVRATVPMRAALAVALIPVLRDNYVFVLHDGRRAVVVDPAIAAPVETWLQERHLELVAVLQTHHHSDHIGGTPELLRRWPAAAVVAARDDKERIPFQTVGVADGDTLTLLGRRLEVLAVPGHTLTHIVFYLPEGSDGPAGDLFCGDTLFAGGCGRLFEGTATQMHRSLQRLAALPEATRLWCAHEYTETNLAWAAQECPNDEAIAHRLWEVRQRRAQDLPTLPSTIALERATNLFVRSRDAEELALRRESRNTW